MVMVNRLVSCGVLFGVCFLSSHAHNLRSLAPSANGYCENDDICVKIFTDQSKPCCNFQSGVCEARTSAGAITLACRNGGGAPAAPAAPAAPVAAPPAGGSTKCGDMTCAANQVCARFTGVCQSISPACTQGQVMERWTGTFSACVDPSQCGKRVDNQDPGYVPSNWMC